MSRQGLLMKKLKEVYRLKFELDYSHHIIAQSLAISSSTVSDYVRLFTGVIVQTSCDSYPFCG